MIKDTRQLGTDALLYSLCNLHPSINARPGTACLVGRHSDIRLLLDAPFPLCSSFSFFYPRIELFPRGLRHVRLHGAEAHGVKRQPAPCVDEYGIVFSVCDTPPAIPVSVDYDTLLSSPLLPGTHHTRPSLPHSVTSPQMTAELSAPQLRLGMYTSGPATPPSSKRTNHHFLGQTPAGTLFWSTEQKNISAAYARISRDRMEMEMEMETEMEIGG